MVANISLSTLHILSIGGETSQETLSSMYLRETSQESLSNMNSRETSQESLSNMNNEIMYSRECSPPEALSWRGFLVANSCGKDGSRKAGKQLLKSRN